MNYDKQKYYNLFWDCQPHPDLMGELNVIIMRILNERERYDKVSDITGIPWWFVAILHKMESDLNFYRHLHNGDPLSVRTYHVPVGRPLLGNPPFTWEESAVDALELSGFTKDEDWSFEGVLFKFEEFNGLGYEKHGINSPYLWSGSDLYQKGKYVGDGQYDPNAVSAQIGAGVIMKKMFLNDIIK